MSIVFIFLKTVANLPHYIKLVETLMLVPVQKITFLFYEIQTKKLSLSGLTHSLVDVSNLSWQRKLSLTEPCCASWLREGLLCSYPACHSGARL